MNIWDRLFGSSVPAVAAAAGPSTRFGRYSDAHKGPANYQAWEEAIQAFEQQDFLASFEAFFRYLRDEAEDNVRFQRQGDELWFEFYQGSKRITGQADARRLRASAPVARLGKVPPELMQRLTAQNYELKYCRFALDNERCLLALFDTSAIDASAHKLYHALKELALQADKQDDLLQAESPAVLPLANSHLQQLSAAERQCKQDFLVREIDAAFAYLSSNQCKPEEHPGAVAYLLLDLVYRLDYLLKPEGPTMEALERMHRRYFAREEEPQAVTFKNVRLIGELQELAAHAPARFDRELYVGKSTFGLTLPVSHDRVAALIRNELPNLEWYQENGFETIALAVPGYVIGYCLFNYAVPLPIRDFFHLYYRIRHEEYFLELGFEQQFLDPQGRPLRRPLRAAIEEIVLTHQAQYPRLRPALATLVYDRLSNFSQAYLSMIADLDLGKAY
ncbi:MAG: YbjN domain-containing protein [Lewinella sp.]|nr:YbjN domain-containing protein [Lewinella sp.]